MVSRQEGEKKKGNRVGRRQRAVPERMETVEEEEEEEEESVEAQNENVAPSSSENDGAAVKEEQVEQMAKKPTRTRAAKSRAAENCCTGAFSMEIKYLCLVYGKLNGFPGMVMVQRMWR